VSPTVGQSSVVVLEEDVQLRTYPQGHLVCAFGTSQAFEVSPTGALLLLNLDSPLSVGELVEHVAAGYGESSMAIEQEILEFLSNCLDLKILRVVSDQSGDGTPQTTDDRQRA